MSDSLDEDIAEVLAPHEFDEGTAARQKVYQVVGSTKYHFAGAKAALHAHLHAHCSAWQLDEATGTAPESVAADERCRANGCRQRWGLADSGQSASMS